MTARVVKTFGGAEYPHRALQISIADVLIDRLHRAWVLRPIVVSANDFCSNPEGELNVLDCWLISVVGITEHQCRCFAVVTLEPLVLVRSHLDDLIRLAQLLQHQLSHAVVPGRCQKQQVPAIVIDCNDLLVRCFPKCNLAGRASE